ncbi:MAG TPA: 2-C-methyl-D-erythritol 4-phosphate cytidylyltransferase [Acidimicrobiia bacterium]|nr:2-C-methyl-D-erythritol 4-phosphate cytidylyltransferase [Acidimicrobiia bacterium]
MPRVWGILVAAGRGDRFGEPKQFCDLAGTRVVDRALRPLAQVCAEVVVVLPRGVAWEGCSTVGGETRSDSVRAGLRAVPDDADVVVVHDAARPLASRPLFDAVIAAVQNGADAAVVAVPVSDTLKRVDGTRVVGTVDRSDLVAVQTPQAFRAGALRDAHRRADQATDDAALVEAAGGTVVVVPGDPRNLKITTPADLLLAAALIER